MTRPAPGCAAFACLLLSVPVWWVGISAVAQTSMPENPPVSSLGKVAQRGAYASNVWDMQVFGGRIYLGAGNSSNLKPEGNAGAGELKFIDLATDTISGTGFTPPEEQIESFRVIDGALVIPGHDLKGIKPPSRFYRLKDGAWTFGTVKGSNYHTYDIYRFGELLFAGVGANGSGQNAAYVSANDGLTWKLAPTPPLKANQVTQRVYRFFEHGGKLYAVMHNPEGYPIRVWNGASFEVAGTPSQKQLFPRNTYRPQVHPVYLALRPERVVNLGKALLYIGAAPTNDHQWEGVALYKATDLARPSRIMLQADEVPWDTLARGDHAYVLTSRRLASGQYEIRILTSTDLVGWATVAKLEQPTFARSFEEVNGEFYLGLGTGTGISAKDQFVGGPSYTAALKAEAGTVLLVRPTRRTR